MQIFILKKTSKKNEMNYHLISDPLVIHFFPNKVLLKWQNYIKQKIQRRFTLK